MLLAVLATLLSYLLNFDYITKNTSPEENLGYLSESLGSQILGAIIWTIAGILSLLLSSFLLIAFRPYKKWIAISCSVFQLFTAFTFFTTGMLAFSITRNVTSHSGIGLTVDDLPAIQILSNVREIQVLQTLGFTSLGLFSVVTAFMSLFLQTFSRLGSVFLFLSGPLIVVFIWLNPEHLLLTVGLAFTWAGLLITGTRMITRGLVEKTDDKP